MRMLSQRQADKADHHPAWLGYPGKATDAHNTIPK